MTYKQIIKAPSAQNSNLTFEINIEGWGAKYLAKISKRFFQKDLQTKILSNIKRLTENQEL
jgi:hypothetical protein